MVFFLIGAVVAAATFEKEEYNCVSRHWHKDDFDDSSNSDSCFHDMSTATGAKKAERSSKTVEKIKQLSFGADESDSSDDEDGDDNRSFGNSDTSKIN